MGYFERLAEERIREAMERGDFDDLPGAGKPIPPEASASVPGELRIAYKLLRDAGYLPPELELKKEIVTLKDLLAEVSEPDERYRLARRINERVLRLNLMLGRSFDREDHQVYAGKLAAKLARD